MYICICNAVTEREIRGAVELGCSSIDDLRRDLGVASCCGKCLPDARKVLRGCAGCPQNAVAYAGGDD
jgi:bacterioferritin-associated ferredoxin